mmetsp:Transcript_16521/g.67856  ORF Transcript_16521/g.67856 Transcript_16521/m.67856 type:complete len:225 (-) Transcript_16521:526-1200(-)
MAWAAEDQSDIYGLPPYRHGEDNPRMAQARTVRFYFSPSRIHERKNDETNNTTSRIFSSILTKTNVFSNYNNQVSIVGATTISAPFQFGWLIVGEVSTIFLNIRWFLIKLGYGATSVTITLPTPLSRFCLSRFLLKASLFLRPQFMTAANFLFALTFFIARIVVYTFGVYDLYYSAQYLTRPNMVGRCMLVGGILIGYVLNLIWFKKIALIGFSKNRKEKDKTK